MNIKDYFKMSSLAMIRGKKKLSYILVILILVILSLGLFVFRHNIEKLIYNTLTKDIGYRTIVTGFRTKAGGFSVGGNETSDALKLENDIKKDIEDFLNIEHVLDAFNSNNWNTVLVSDLANENVDGTITLLRGSIKILPQITAGKTFEEGETGVAICPEKFYPNFEPLQINKDKIIDGHTLLNASFTVEYNDYILNNLHRPEKNQTFTKEFKIVGLYDNSQRMNDNGVCYISVGDITEITNTENAWNKSVLPTLVAVVDTVDNIDNVISQAEKLGFENISLGSSLNMDLINIIRLSIVSVFCLILFTIIILTSAYVKKKINREEKTIALLRTYGYSKNTIRYLYVLEILVTNSFIFIIGIAIFLTSYFIALQNVVILVTANLMIGGITIGSLSLIFTFLITVALPCLITTLHINKKCSQDIIKLIGNEE